MKFTRLPSRCQTRGNEHITWLVQVRNIKLLMDEHHAACAKQGQAHEDVHIRIATIFGRPSTGRY